MFEQVQEGLEPVNCDKGNAKCDTPSVTSEQQLYNDWQEEISQLPLGVVKPRWKPGIIPKMWQESREYFDTIIRLLVLTVAELKEQGQWIPSWKYKSEGLLR